MVPALALAFLLGGAGSSLTVLQDASVAGLVKDACVVTGLRREAFEQTARERGWRSSRITRQSGETDGWNVVYRADGATIIMSGTPVAGPVDPSLASLCTVLVHRPQGEWLADIEELAAELGMDADVDPQLPGEVETRSWSKPLSQTLTSAYQPATRRVSVTLSRQVVINTE